MRKKTAWKKPRYSLNDERCLAVLRSMDDTLRQIIIDELDAYLLMLSKLTPSSKTHYHRLDEWSDPVYEVVSTMLDKHGFINGDIGSHKTKPAVQFWWGIYGTLSSICDSAHIETSVASHHASAKERHDAFVLHLNEMRTAAFELLTNKEKSTL